MNFSTAFIELEQKIEHLVARHTKLKETNDALRREIAFLRQENQRLQREQDEIEERLGRIIERVQGQESTKFDGDQGAGKKQEKTDNAGASHQSRQEGGEPELEEEAPDSHYR